jgi:ubiquitin carboxyl-terminal hydrolase 14
VKWGKELLSDIELDKSQDVMTFKAIMYALTNVPVDKQKIMVKGKMLKDTDDLSKFDIVDGMTLMMMGAAEGKTL